MDDSSYDGPVDFDERYEMYNGFTIDGHTLVQGETKDEGKVDSSFALHSSSSSS